MTEEEVAAETNGQKKTENAEVDPAELDSSIIRQVEYYFSDVNLGRDRFLREQLKLDDGWLPLDVLIKFKRLASLSTDLERIADALKKSTSGLLEVSEDKKKIRRNPEIPILEMNEERRKELVDRTVYAKGFPKDSILDDLLKFFNEHGNVESVTMRRYPDKTTKQRLFKGSVFTVFKSKDEATKFLEQEELKYKDSVLLRYSQEEYSKKKQEEFAERKEKREKDKKNKESNAVEEAKEAFKLPTGTVIHFCNGAETMKREDVHEALTKIGAEIAFIDFKVGDKEGWVRLAKENQAKGIHEKITDGKIKIGENEVEFKVVEGEEETKYLEKSVEEMIKRRKNQRSFGRSNRNFRGGNQRGRKRRQNNHDDAPAAKVKADS